MAKNIRDQFLDYLGATGMSVAEFSRRSGVSYDVLNKLKRRDSSSTSAENAERIRNVIETVVESQYEAQIAAPSLNEDTPAFQRVEPGEPVQTEIDLVPVYDLSASAGYGAVIDQETEVYSLAFPPAYLKRLTSSSPGNLAIISVKGESMEPTLLDDDIVLLDASKTNLSFDGLFVLRFNDALHVKRVGRSVKRGHVMIISDNRELYPPLDAAVDDIEPVGKVLWYGRKV